jgi:tetratricopeptide (TPR) repeat protein
MNRTNKPGQEVPLSSPPSVEHAFEEALNLHRAGRLDEAEKLYLKVLEAQPDHFNSFRLLGVIDDQRGNHEAAVRHIDAALKINPNFAEAFNSRGNALKKMQRWDEALASYDQAIALNPGYAGAFNNRGTALHKLKRIDEALGSFDQAIALNPDYAVAFNNRGNALKEIGRLDEALASYDQAIALKPDYADAFKNRGTLLQELWRLDEALVSYDQAIALKPDYAEVFNNRGSALHHLKRLDEALTSYDRAIALKPDFANAIVNRGMTRLLFGRFQEGWPDFEWRWAANGLPRKQPQINAPVWQGEDLAGRRIAVYAEQGLGDVIQFARYLPRLAELGADVAFLAPAKLVRLLRTLPSKVGVVSSIDGAEPFDFQCALMSLPFWSGTELSSIPDEVPYLNSERDLVARWAHQLGHHGFKIGIAWQGKPDSMLDRGRSIALAEFVPLSWLPGVRLISLQKNHGLDQLASLPAGTNVEILSDEFDSGPDAFIDTAAVMANLDLIITSDTSIAHLAGALGRPTWVVLSYVPDWRWLLDQEDCPWYPTMRLFRQRIAGDWKSVFSNIERQLRPIQAQ